MNAALPRDHAMLTGANWALVLLRGIAAILLGAACLFFPIPALFAFTLMFAAYVAVDGILSVIAGVRGAARHQAGWGTLIVRGVLGLGLAGLFVAMPGALTLSYALLVLGSLSCWAILAGVLELAAAARLGRPRWAWPLGLSGLLSILLGIAVLWLMLQEPLVSVLWVAWFVGGYAILAGIALIAFALRLRRFATQGATSFGA